MVGNMPSVVPNIMLTSRCARILSMAFTLSRGYLNSSKTEITTALLKASLSVRLSSTRCTMLTKILNLRVRAWVIGMGFPFLKAASESYEAVCELLETMVAEMNVAMQLSGAASIGQLREVDIVVSGEKRNWLTMRGFEDELKAMAQRWWRKGHYIRRSAS